MANFDENDGVWRTMDNGQKIFIRKGESFKDAYKRKLSMKKGNNKSLREVFNKREDDDEEKIANMKINSTPESKKRVLIKSWEAEEKKIRQDIGDLLNKTSTSEQDYNGRKIKVTNANKDMTDEDADKLDKLQERLRIIEYRIRKYK